LTLHLQLQLADMLMCADRAGGALLLAGLAFCVAVARKRRHRGHGAGDKAPGATPNLMGVLFGTPAGTSSGVLTLKMQESSFSAPQH
jgi:hypothetical protein